VTSNELWDQVWCLKQLAALFLGLFWCSIFTQTWRSTLQGTNISAKKWHFEDDFPFPKVGYVNSLENYVSFPGTKLRVGRGWPGFFLGKQTLQLLAGASFPSFPPKCRSLTRDSNCDIFMVDPILSCSLEPQTTSLKWMFLWTHHFSLP